MAKILPFLVVTLCVIGVSCSTVQAGGFAIDEQGAAAMGRANAFVAQADDPSALFYNPAGASQLDGTQFSLGTTLIVPSATFDSDTGESTDTESALFFPSTFYVVHRLRETLHIGMGVFSPFGLSADWPSDWEGRFFTTFSEINTLYINPNVIWSPSPEIRVAAGISYVLSTTTLENKLELTPLPDGNVEIKADGDGWGYNLALMALLPGQNSLGLTFRSPVKIDYDGEAKFNLPAPLTGFAVDASSSLRLPAIVVVGLANRALSGYTFEADIQWTGWASIKKQKVDFDDPVPDSEIRKDWENSYTFRLGVEHSMEQLTLRGGYAYDITPIPSKTLDPSLPDANKHTLTVGGGYKMGKAKLDMAYMLVLLNDRNADNTLDTGGTPFTHKGTYSTTLHEVGLSLTYAF